MIALSTYCVRSLTSAAPEIPLTVNRQRYEHEAFSRNLNLGSRVALLCRLGLPKRGRPAGNALHARGGRFSLQCF